MASNKRITSLAPKENVRQLPCLSLCSGRLHECFNLAANCPKPVAGFDASVSGLTIDTTHITIAAKIDRFKVTAFL